MSLCAALLLALAPALASPPAPAPVPQGPAPEIVVLQQSPVVLADNYYQQYSSNCAGFPLGTGCHATLVGIYYPDGKGPPSLGYSNPPSPVVIQLRGGNSNVQFPDQLGWFQSYVLPHGFVGVDPSYPPVYAPDDYTASAKGIAYLIQYLRYYHEWFNIDPNRIFVFGRSFGGVMAMTVGLKEDYQDLASPDPFKHESSRPNYMIPFSAMADLTCLSTSQVLWDWLLYLWFPVATAPGATTAQKLADSPAYWLVHPELYQRPFTPPMCLGYGLNAPHPCGEIVDPHDGWFGLEMLDKGDELAFAQNDAAYGLSNRLINTSDVYAFSEAMVLAMNWAVEQLQPKEAALYLIPPKTPVGPAGSYQALQVIGATPGALVGYFFGFSTGAVFVPGCANIDTGLLDFYPLGWKFADAQGRAALNVWAPPQAIGLDIVVHVADFANCEVSQLMHKTWTQ